MKKNKSPLSLRTSKKLKNKLNKMATKDDKSISEFLVVKIKKEYEYAKQLKELDDACEIINNIAEIMERIILDENSNPYDEFCNDFILQSFYTVKHLSGNIDVDIPCLDTGYDGTKTEHISVRAKREIIKKLDYIADVYECKKSDIMPLLLSKKKDSSMIPDAPDIIKCFCYITDIRNYFYEKHIDVKDFEKEYGRLWKIMQ